MEEKYISPCRSDEICKGCHLKRSCSNKMGVPNCVKQFMSGLDIKESVNKSDEVIATLQQENDQLQLKNKELVEALKPFANKGKQIVGCGEDPNQIQWATVNRCYIKASESYDRSVKSEEEKNTP